MSAASHSTSQLSQKLKTTYKASTSKVRPLRLAACFLLAVQMRPPRRGGRLVLAGQRRRGRSSPRTFTVFSSTFFLPVAAFELLPRQSRWRPQLQRNQLGVVGWRLMGNLSIISLTPPPSPKSHPPFLLARPPPIPLCMNSLAGRWTAPPPEIWWFTCRSLSSSLGFCVR